MCYGPGACLGGQACLASGTGYGPCNCGNADGGSGPDAPMVDAMLPDAPACLSAEPPDAGAGITCMGLDYDAPRTETNVYVWLGGGLPGRYRLFLESRLLSDFENIGPAVGWGYLEGQAPAFGTCPTLFQLDYVGSAFLTDACCSPYGQLESSPATEVTVMIDGQRYAGSSTTIVSVHCRGTAQLHYVPPM